MTFYLTRNSRCSKFLRSTRIYKKKKYGEIKIMQCATLYFKLILVAQVNLEGYDVRNTK